MALLGLVFAGVYSVLCIIRTYHKTKYGLGLPLALRPPQNIVTYLEVNYAGRPIYQIGISFFKIALLIGYLRLLQGTSNKAYRGAIWCTIAFVSVSHVGSAMSFVALRLSADREVVETRSNGIQFGDGNTTMLGCVGRDRIPRGHDYVIAALSGTGLPTRGQGALLQAKPARR
ncbi:hypothetical protein NHJ6243_010208 [Beauveria neobassiana]